MTTSKYSSPIKAKLIPSVDRSLSTGEVQECLLQETKGREEKEGEGGKRNFSLPLFLLPFQYGAFSFLDPLLGEKA